MRYLFAVILILVPVFIISHFFALSNEIKEEKEILEKPQETKKVTILSNEADVELELEDYIVGVVACEMPASFEFEALKAMAVAARTYALNKITNNPEYVLKTSTDDQCFINEEDMQEKWQQGFDKYYNKILSAVYSTKGEYLSYENNPIKAFYFSTSNGYTENVEDVFLEKLDYLVSVSSPWDTESSGYKKTILFTIDEFLKLLNIQDVEIKNIKIEELTNSNRVKTISVNDKKFKGTEFRKLLKLRSTDFIIEKNENKIVITTKGYGHGVGLSQYGANGMAKEGKNYEEILKYYYKNVELKRV